MASGSTRMRSSGSGTRVGRKKMGGGGFDFGGLVMNFGLEEGLNLRRGGFG